MHHDSADPSVSVSLALSPLIERALPGFRIRTVRAIGSDAEVPDGSHKGAGYGAPLYIEVERGSQRIKLVLHTATANPFGHDRRADRAAEMLLAFDTFGAVPRHVSALDVGVYLRDGTTASLREAGEFYLLSEFAEGEPYAHDLREIQRRGSLLPRDRARAQSLVDYLAELHQSEPQDVTAWQRAIRDLFGSGEGLFGLIDNYPAETPAAPSERLERLETLALGYRARLRALPERLVRIHGDFHPFNIVFSEQQNQPALLDASRGCRGEAVDDLVCLAINYLFFGLLAEGSARSVLFSMFGQCFERYLKKRSDPSLLACAPPYLAWRALVLCNPLWYPDFDSDSRDRLLSYVEETLRAGILDPERAVAALTSPP